MAASFVSVNFTRPQQPDLNLAGAPAREPNYLNIQWASTKQDATRITTTTSQQMAKLSDFRRMLAPDLINVLLCDILRFRYAPTPGLASIPARPYVPAEGITTFGVW